MALASFSLDGRRLLLVCGDNAARLWDAVSGKPAGDAMRHKAALTCAVFDAEARRVATASADGLVQLWDGATGKLLKVALRHDRPVAGVSFSADGERLLTASSDGTARLWRASDGSALGHAMEHPAAVTSAQFSAGDKQVLSLCEDGLLRHWDAGTQKLLDEPMPVGKFPVLAIDGKSGLMAIGDAEGRVRLWPGGGAKPLDIEFRHEGRVRSLQFSLDGRLLLSAADDGLARIWVVDGGKLQLGLKHKGEVLDAAFDGESARVVTVAADQVARVWDAGGGKLIGPTILLNDAAAESGGTSTTPAPGLVSIGAERVVTVGGVVGIFKPITNATEEPVGDDERANLLAMIDQLKLDNATLQGSNLQLAADLATLRVPPSAPDDFATGVQRSLDELQQRLALMSNPVTNFAVRGFKLETSVFVQVSVLGGIEYRFVQPGDKVEPTSMSRLTLDLVPVPKSSLAGVWTPTLFQPEVPVALLPGLAPAQAGSLEELGLFSIGEFLQVATRGRAQAYLEALLATSRQQLAAWAQQAMLMTLRGVDGALAGLLIEAGFGSFNALAAALPEVVVAALDSARPRRPDLDAAAVDVALAALWVQAARQYLGQPAGVG